MKELKELREKIHKDIERCKLIKNQAYERFYNVLNVDSKQPILITYEHLQTLEIDERVKLSEDVEFIKISETDNEMVFHTVMIAGGKFVDHFHNCVEICKVLKGTLIETVNDGRLQTRVLKEGDRAIYDYGNRHAMTVDEYTLLEVRFIKEL